MSTEEQKPTVLLDVLSKLGLKKYYPNNLSLQSILEVNKSSIHKKAVLSVDEMPFHFLRKLFQINAGCRNCTPLLSSHEDDDYSFDTDLYTANDPSENTVHPLDLIVGLFLCADSFLQQEIALKMSLCQFSAPLLLPQTNSNQCTLMIWALREIVKEWCPHDMCQSRGFVEDNIVQAKIPFFSFVRLKNCSLSKSQFLNQVLSRGQQNHNMFIHRDMEGGALTRKLSNGLVEVCWFLPCGRENLDIFPEPVAFANLRGHICESQTQFAFLYEVSNAIFVFLDEFEEEEHHILKALQDAKSKLYFVVLHKERVTDDVKKTLEELDVPKSNVKVKHSRANTAEFTKVICGAIKNSLCSIKSTMSIEDMVEKAVVLGLTVDENKTLEHKETVEKILRGVGVRSIPHFKKQQLPLQGEKWKRLSQLEKQECRISNVGTGAVEHYKAQIQEEKIHIWKEQNKQNVSQGMHDFIKTLSTSNTERRNVFLKWMKFKFNSHSRDKLTRLRNTFKEQCKTNDAKLIAEIDQALLDTSLGVEHYMREMGLYYEVSFHSDIAMAKISHLPKVAAEMLLGGYSLELLDGVASNIPENWVTDMLMELHKMVGEKSRLLVLTVLGVQSTGKSTLLNTMFGVQFPVSSGRCTRGAYMLFLKVEENTEKELGCDFILLIDTEGLKSPDLAQLEDSYEHDNQLATFVIGLSDVTIVNIAMENANEMKDVLQIAVHAFLRMKQIGKKTICHFVHQNVAGVSAHTRTLTERKHLLDQLNQMTQIAAHMERTPGIQAFTDVLDYDVENNNWNIPGLWHGTPPMAPVNTGYSEAVSEFKKYLLETVRGKKQSKASNIPEFLQWMRSLWKSVKYENFIFSFRNTLVAHAYENLCKEFNQWEWEMRKEILSRQTAAELEVVNANNKNGLETWNALVMLKKTELAEEIESQKRKMKEKLADYYRKKDSHVNLIEKYKTDFLNSITSLSNEIQHSVNSNLEGALERKIALKKALDIIQEYCGRIEDRVMKLLSDCKDTQLSDDQLREEFDKMWAAATAYVPALKKQEIPAAVLNQLRKNCSYRNVSEDLQHIKDLTSYGKASFMTYMNHVDSIAEKFKHTLTGKLQIFANEVIATSTTFVVEQTKSNSDYHDSLSRDLLKMIDDLLFKHSKPDKFNIQFEIDIKLHICGFAAREFLLMHQRFLSNNDPRTQLEKYKPQYLSDFLDLYKQEDHCQRKANDFVQFCIKPAIEDYLNRVLGIDIVDLILTSSHSVEYSSRSSFQYNLQKELLRKNDFDAFVKYIRHYKMYVKDWIFEQILKKMQDNTLCDLKQKNLDVVVTKILNAIKESLKKLSDDNDNVPKLVSIMRTYLSKDVVILEDTEKRTLFQIKSTCQSFTQCFIASLSKLKETLHEEFSYIEDIPETLNKLAIKPQDELFKKVFGCGHQCPFCKIPCEAGGKEHKMHHAAVHRPQGLGQYRNNINEVLVEVLCTSDVYGAAEFQHPDKAEVWVPYRDYSTTYPDWHIPPDPTMESSDYWKFVLVHYNERFAKEYQAKPAKVPEAWKKITKAKALKGLNDSFNIR
ncbi:up-regulator of cell proliferation-like [Entelurus aequoreus]|uniref:up-regulator of cell proliferation-like n=1 Tax=Entelurus aequoreus TaxID=161455 RepID=UPI002B1D5F7F|nr:up-regulator of cell proliferation-like [Entelurus aequoreus]